MAMPMCKLDEGEDVETLVVMNIRRWFIVITCTMCHLIDKLLLKYRCTVPPSMSQVQRKGFVENPSDSDGV